MAQQQTKLITQAEFNALAKKPFSSLTREQKQAMMKFDTAQNKAKDGSYTTVAVGDEGQIQFDIQPIDQTLPAAERKHTGKGEPYLFSLDGFRLQLPDGRFARVSTFYAIIEPAK